MFSLGNNTTQYGKMSSANTQRGDFFAGNKRTNSAKDSDIAKDVYAIQKYGVTDMFIDKYLSQPNFVSFIKLQKVSEIIISEDIKSVDNSQVVSPSAVGLKIASVLYAMEKTMLAHNSIYTQLEMRAKLKDDALWYDKQAVSKYFQIAKQNVVGGYSVEWSHAINIPDKLFAGDKKIDTLTINLPESKKHNITIGAQAFANSSLKRFECSNKLCTLHVGTHAFENCPFDMHIHTEGRVEFGFQAVPDLNKHTYSGSFMGSIRAQSESANDFDRLL